MTKLDDIRRAVHQEKRWLHNLHALDLNEGESIATPIRFKPGQVEAMLRVEITEDVLVEFGARDHTARDLIMRFFANEQEGPVMVEGVAWYVLRKLPAPGWRVVNPLRRQA